MSATRELLIEQITHLEKAVASSKAAGGEYAALESELQRKLDELNNVNKSLNEAANILKG